MCVCGGGGGCGDWAGGGGGICEVGGGGMAPNKRYINIIFFIFLYENICCGTH